MLDKTLNFIRQFIPKGIYSFFQPAYHYTLSVLGAIIYRFPGKEINIIAVTGTKGKSTTVEIINAILEQAKYKTAVSNTIRFKIGDDTKPNMYKMSMPGRFFIQKFLRDAVNAKCDFVVMEITSQGVLNFRHKFLNLNSLVFTNLSPEHIESHGSYENYRDAKLDIAYELSRSNKRPRILVVNGDDKESEKFLKYDAEKKVKFYINNNIQTPLLGEFNKYNVSGAYELCKELGIKEETIKQAISKFNEVSGRVQFIKANQDFDVIVDYAHTTDSLEKLYKTFGDRNKIAVLGGTGGGRDIWKRSEMGKIADKYCKYIVLTNEDPYDEDPEKIINDVAKGIINQKPTIIMDRRLAIRDALLHAKKGDLVLITGKGTDPYIMGPNGKNTPWSDAKIAREEIEYILNNKTK
jgi:UDP-N-acetylmuramoyl-L-alanyl-D-glutamate--2,6-diaminopimelate ligase